MPELRVIVDTSLHEYFHDSVHSALSRQQVQAQRRRPPTWSTC